MLKRLQADGFRNLQHLDWQPAPGPQLLLGDNGAGKTSLLEAIYLLATTRSFRTAQISDCRRQGADRLDLVAEVQSDARARLEISLAGTQRQRRLNGSDTSLAEHLAVLPVAAWTARDGELVTGPPEERRRFLDRGVVGLKPRSLEAIGRYRRILGQKRQTLVRGQGGLEAWNEMLAGCAAELICQRQDYVNLVSEELAAVLEGCGWSFPGVTLAYKPSLETAREPEEIYRRLARLEKQERHRMRPLAGPHLDDLEICWNGRPLKRVASAGEKKAFCLALLAAHGRVLRAAGRGPIYLLDDADTELSEASLKKVWKAFEGCGQLIASSNRPEVWRALPVDARWHLEEGALTELPARTPPGSP